MSLFGCHAFSRILPESTSSIPSRYGWQFFPCLSIDWKEVNPRTYWCYILRRLFSVPCSCAAYIKGFGSSCHCSWAEPIPSFTFFSSLFYVLSPFSFLRILVLLLLLTPVYSSASTTVTHSLCLFSLIQNEPLLPLCFAVCIPSASLFSRSSTGIRFLALLPMPPTCLVRISKPAPTLKEKSPPCLFIFLHFVVLYLHLCHLLLFFSTPSIASISANWHFYRFLFLFS